MVFHQFFSKVRFKNHPNSHSYYKGILPESWKDARMLLIPKKGSKSILRTTDQVIFFQWLVRLWSQSSKRTFWNIWFSRVFLLNFTFRISWQIYKKVFLYAHIYRPTAEVPNFWIFRSFRRPRYTLFKKIHCSDSYEMSVAEFHGVLLFEYCISPKKPVHN